MANSRNSAAPRSALTGSIDTCPDPERVDSGAKSLRLDESQRVRKAIAAQRARAAAGCTNVEQLSLRIGVSPTVLKKQENRSEPHEPRFSQMLAVKEYGLHLAAAVAEHHGARVEPAAEVVHATHGARLASVTAESCELLTALTAALADGQLSPSEIATVRAEAKGLMGAVLELEAALVAAERGSR